MDHRNVRCSNLCGFVSGHHRYQQLLWVTAEILTIFGFCAIFDLQLPPENQFPGCQLIDKGVLGLWIMQVWEYHSNPKRNNQYLDRIHDG
jgi:hypothetical protein